MEIFLVVVLAILAPLAVPMALEYIDEVFYLWERGLVLSIAALMLLSTMMYIWAWAQVFISCNPFVGLLLIASFIGTLRMIFG